ncbi:hypothetical protein GCM10007879_03360 [Maritalea porphyrae]|uniref:Uncharacterized protein n=1 Tax=Maritalea porphyrae TaxID=880732 RepID=A0ABQ5UQ61_9HYPH|nr:hypothetical protein GCM10007879_03360 [Maritalea porphyrae]
MADIEGGGTVSAVLRVDFEGGGYVINSLCDLYAFSTAEPQAAKPHTSHAQNAWCAMGKKKALPKRIEPEKIRGKL